MRVVEGFSADFKGADVQGFFIEEHSPEEYSYDKFGEYIGKITSELSRTIDGLQEDRKRPAKEEPEQDEDEMDQEAQ